MVTSAWGVPAACAVVASVSWMQGGSAVRSVVHVQMFRCGGQCQEQAF